jgi:hypothetical protein
MSEEDRASNPQDRAAVPKRDPGERQKAIDRLMKLLNFRLGGRKFSRDELYDRKSPQPKDK